MVFPLLNLPGVLPAIAGAANSAAQSLRSATDPKKRNPNAYGRPDPFAPTNAAMQSAANAYNKAGYKPTNRTSTGLGGGIDRMLAEAMSRQGNPSFNSPSVDAYQSPKPIYSEAQFRQALEQDFNYAQRAATIARNDQRYLEAGRALDQRRALNAQAANQLRTAGGSQRDIMRDQYGYQSGLMDRQTSNALRVQGGSQRQLQADRLASAERLQQMATGQSTVSRSYGTQDYLRQAEAATRAMGQQAAMNRQAMNDAAELQYGIGGKRSTSSAGAQVQDYTLWADQSAARLAATYEQNARLKQLKAAADGNYSSGGGSSSGGGGMDYAAAINAAREAARQDRADQLQGQKELIQAQASANIRQGQAQMANEDELRRRAALRAVQSFNAAGGGQTRNARQVALDDQGIVRQGRYVQQTR